LSLCQQ